MKDEVKSQVHEVIQTSKLYLEVEVGEGGAGDLIQYVVHHHFIIMHHSTEGRI